MKVSTRGLAVAGSLVVLLLGGAPSVATALPRQDAQPHAVATLVKCDKGWCRLKASHVQGWVRQEDIWGGGPAPVCRPRKD